jgi:hypothetical protein
MTEFSGINAETVQAIADTTIARLAANGMLSTGKKRIKRHNWENQMAYEWATKYYNDHPKWFRVGVGPDPDSKGDPLYYKLKRYADLIVRLPEEILIVEFKMMAIPDCVGQLLNYMELFPQTPQFMKYKDEPRKGMVVCGMVDQSTKEHIERNGFEVEIWQSKGFEDWYKMKILKQEIE